MQTYTYIHSQKYFIKPTKTKSCIILIPSLLLLMLVYSNNIDSFLFLHLLLQCAGPANIWETNTQLLFKSHTFDNNFRIINNSFRNEPILLKMLIKTIIMCHFSVIKVKKEVREVYSVLSLSEFSFNVQVFCIMAFETV